MSTVLSMSITSSLMYRLLGHTKVFDEIGLMATELYQIRTTIFLREICGELSARALKTRFSQSLTQCLHSLCVETPLQVVIGRSLQTDVMAKVVAITDIYVKFHPYDDVMSLFNTSHRNALRGVTSNLNFFETAICKYINAKQDIIDYLRKVWFRDAYDLV